MSLTSEQEPLVNSLEDIYMLLQKTQVNLKKCPKQRLTKGYIDAKIQCVEDYWKTYVATHQNLVRCTPKAKRSDIAHFEKEEYFLAEELYSTLKGHLKDMMYVLSERRQSSPSANSSQMDTSFSGNVQNSTVHLPRIQLPKFTGNYEAWPAFKDLFSSLVHENTALSDVQRLHYLKISVAGEAESLLKHVQVTSSNYTTAWQILKTRYGNKRLILNSIMKKLFNQKKMTSQSAVQLKGLLDTTTECLSSLQNLDISTASWDLIIIHLLVQKLDPETHKNWEEYAYRDEKEALPTWEEFKRFMESKFRTLELVNANTTTNIREVKVKERSLHVTTPITEKTSKTCVMCKEDHTLCHCKDFIKLEPKERSEFVKNKHLCFNCLVPGHSVSRCKLPVSCRICHRRHHSLLHETKETEPAATTSSSLVQPLVSQHVAEEEEEVQINTMITSHFTTGQGCALLATAIVEATSENGQPTLLRALIDQGSEASFISEKAAQLLQLTKHSVKGTVIGVGSTKTEIKHVVQLKIRSRCDGIFSLRIQAYIMPKQLTTKIPTKTITKQAWPHLQGLDLADPNYFTPGSIDLLLGVKEYAQIVQQELIKGPPGSPCAQKTTLGWILFGTIQQKPEEHAYLRVMHHQVDMDEVLKSIWEIEIDSKRKHTTEEKTCENIYKNTTTRNAEGRYVVSLPFRTDNPQSPYGNTKEIAKQRFMQLERRFRKSPNLKEEYSKVIDDYIKQEHIEKIPKNERDVEKAVYLPHHAVVREDKETSRTRVVFDASCKGSNNISLNQELLVGPQLQDDLRNLIMRWRAKKVCFVADIKQMYRQILVTKSDADFQRIFWRINEQDDLQEYRLLRVTFGTAPAPYLAVRTLHQVADDEGEGKPQAVQAIKSNFYIDDYLDGADTAEEAKSLSEDVAMILQKGGFELAKWSSNNLEFMRSIPEDQRSSNALVDINLDSTIKALGIVWKLKTDTFQYNLNLSSVCHNVTKRQILSDIQKLFDPLGWISPSTVLAKILIQKLWLEKVNWDETINDTLQKEWKQIRSDFNNVKKIQIDRWLGTSKTNTDSIQLHGFSDASMRAYAAVVYIRITTADDEIKTKIIAARTRVAPLKTISLPRLELNGALLLSKLMKQVGEAMNIPTSRMYAWTDSSIVIAWLSGEPNRWKAFVANRVVEIVENLHNKHWHHVDSKDNPADLASRGMLLSELTDCDLWWKGPRWLSEKEIHIRNEEMRTDLERKTTKINTYLNTEDEETETSIHSKFDKFNNLTELLKTIIYCKRFLYYKKNANIDTDITTQELEDSLTVCIKRVQHEDYPEEIERLAANKQVKKKSPLRFLNPYLDEKQLLRVGGRLRHSKLPDERKHPIILSSINKLTPLIVADAHVKTLYGGVQLMLCYLQSKYWIFKAKSLCRRHIHKCFICAKLSARTKSQVMGNLPEVRVTPARPFSRCGVDFAGPYQILMSKGRGSKSLKAYIAIFVCMSTKAIHIELVGDLSSEAFIGAFRRFVARRGKCSDIWSDQGRNFVGANKELNEAWTEAKLQFKGEIAEILATEGTQWHFIPAYSPSYGGLWEAGVKSIKHHLKRILTSHLTFEEMTTVLCQIEACLNSRPLCPIDNSDPDHISPLTPGHFLIGDVPIVVPTPDLTNIRVSALSRWQHTQKLLNDFWKRWQNEYLSRLQQRPKWLKKEEEFKIGDVVLIKTENLPPGKWCLGRIVDKHPGSDGFTRVYSVKSGSTVTKRTVTKLCPLPIDYS